HVGAGVEIAHRREHARASGHVDEHHRGAIADRRDDALFKLAAITVGVAHRNELLIATGDPLQRVDQCACEVAVTDNHSPYLAHSISSRRYSRTPRFSRIRRISFSLNAVATSTPL